MTKVRVYELAKELNMTSKEFMEAIEGLDLKIASHMSSIEEEEAELIKELLTEDKNKEEETEVEVVDVDVEEEKIRKKPKKNNKKKTEQVTEKTIE